MIRKLKGRLKNKDTRSLIENFLSLSSLQFLGMVLPLITLPYLIRVLGVSNYGIIILSSSLIAYFTSITDYSFRITATRDVAVFRNSQKKLNLIYSKVIVVKLLLLTLSCIILLTVVYLYPPFFKERLVFFLTILMLFGYAIFPEWFFQGIEKMKYITFLNLGVKLFFTIAVFFFIKKKDDYWIYPLLQSSGFIIAGIIGQYILIKKYKLKLLWIPFNMVRRTLVKNFPIFINQLLPTLYNNTSSFLLGLLSGTSMLGAYDAIKKIIDLCIVLIGVVSRVFFPYLNRNKNSFYKYKKLMFLLGSSLSIIPIVLSPLILWYLKLNSNNNYFILTILSLGILGYTMYDIFGVNYFIINRQDKLVMANTLTASIIGIILAFPLIYYFDIIGAAINLTLSRFLMGGLLLYKWNINEKNKGINHMVEV